MLEIFERSWRWNAVPVVLDIEEVPTFGASCADFLRATGEVTPDVNAFLKSVVGEGHGGKNRCQKVDISRYSTTVLVYSGVYSVARWIAGGGLGVKGNELIIFRENDLIMSLRRRFLLV